MQCKQPQRLRSREALMVNYASKGDQAKVDRLLMGDASRPGCCRRTEAR